MRHLSAWWAGGLLAAAVVAGCGPGKELPDVTPAPVVAPAGPPPDPNGPAPAASEPEARAVLDRAVKAVTGSVPGGLARARLSRVTAAGKWRFQPDREEMSDATCRLVAAWPDRGHALFDLDQLKATCRFRGRQGSVTKGFVTPQRNSPDLARVFRSDFHARHWIPLSLTLADDKTVAFGKVPTAAGTAVKVAVPDPPDLPVFLVTFDDKTGVPVRVEYHGVEGRSDERAHKVYVLSAHKPAGGYFLPGDIKISLNGRLVEHWTTREWEFPEKLDDTLFDPPKE